MINAVAMARLEQVDELSDDNVPPSSKDVSVPSSKIGELEAKPAVQKQKKGLLPTSKAKPQAKSSGPRKKPSMKRPAAASTDAGSKPVIKAWKYLYHQKKMFGIKVRVGKETPHEVLTALGTDIPAGGQFFLFLLLV